MKTTADPEKGSINLCPGGSESRTCCKQLYLLPAHLRKDLILVIEY